MERSEAVRIHHASLAATGTPCPSLGFYTSQTQLCRAPPTLLRENSLVPLVKRIPEVRLFELVDGLAVKLLGAGKSAKEPHHDMGAIGLKTVVGELAATDAAAAAIKRLAPKLTAYLSSSVPPHVSPHSLHIPLYLSRRPSRAVR